MNVIYPGLRCDYTYSVGSLAEEFISGILELEGFEVKPHKVNENGVDVCLERENVGIEAWNWRDSHSCESRFQSVVENLKPYKYKFLVTSHISPQVKSRFEMHYRDNPIVVIELGFQLLLKQYEDFYRKRKETEGKRFASKRTLKILRNRLAPLFNVLKKKDTCTSTTGAYVYNRSNILLDSPSSFSNTGLLQYHNRDKSTRPGHYKIKPPRKTGEVRVFGLNKIIEALNLFNQVFKSMRIRVPRKSLRFHISRIKVLRLIRK